MNGAIDPPLRMPIVPVGDRDKCWGCGLSYEWSGTPQLCIYCADLYRLIENRGCRVTDAEWKP